MGRRSFVKGGLLLTGTGAVLAAGRELLEGGAPAATEPTAKTLALTVDGRLVSVSSSETRPLDPPAEEIRRGIPGRRWVMVIDLAACDGCGDCQTRCAEMHFLPAGREWLRLYKMQDSPDTAPYWFPKPCFHCDNPPCTRVCPVGGTYKRQDGIVLVDNERCIGCRFCMAACPYSSRVFNWEHPTAPPEAAAQPYSPERGFPRRVGTVEKCDFCPDMAREGKLPHCASECSMGAIYFGDENEDAVTNGKGETVRLSELLLDRAGYRYFEELGTDPRVYYLPPTNRRYPAPSPMASHPTSHHAEEAGR